MVCTVSGNIETCIHISVYKIVSIITINVVYDLWDPETLFGIRTYLPQRKATRVLFPFYHTRWRWIQDPGCIHVGHTYLPMDRISFRSEFI